MYFEYSLLAFLGILTGIFIMMAFYRYFLSPVSNQPSYSPFLHSNTETPTYNPFFYSNPVSCDQLIGCEKALRTIVGRILNRGQSSAITGSPRSGKTSMLECLQDSEHRNTLYGDSAAQLIFSYVHIARLGKQVNEAQFWEYALKPLQDRIANETESSLFKAYENCRQTAFDSYALEKLIEQIKQADWQLVLLLDRFDSILLHPMLNSPALFSHLRSLSSLSKGALTLVTTENRSLHQLNQDIKAWFELTSPLGNIFEEIVLGSLDDSDIDKLLSQGGKYFSNDDCRFLKEMAGGHPYLLQVAASILWNAYKNGDEQKATQRQQQTKQECYNRVEETLNEIWLSWTDEMREALTYVAQLQIETLPTPPKKRPSINEVELTNRLSELEPQLKELKKYGFVISDENANWRVYPSIFLHFVAENRHYDFAKE